MRKQRAKRGEVDEGHASLSTSPTVIYLFLALAADMANQRDPEFQPPRSSRAYQCVYCDTLFEFKTDLNTHYRSKHKSALKDFRNYLTNGPSAA